MTAPSLLLCLLAGAAHPRPPVLSPLALVLAGQEGCRRRRKGSHPRVCRCPFPSACG
jgi:hypothetical protein